MNIVEINGLSEPTETTVVDENYRPVTVKLTLAQAEVAAALYGLTNVDPLPQVEPSEVFPRRDNAHNGARRTFNKLVERGLVTMMPAGHWPRYKVTQALFDALIEWKNNPKNYDAFQNFELSRY
jgi:hypothetical protein